MHVPEQRHKLQAIARILSLLKRRANSGRGLVPFVWKPALFTSHGDDTYLYFLFLKEWRCVLNDSYLSFPSNGDRDTVFLSLSEYLVLIHIPDYCMWLLYVNLSMIHHQRTLRRDCALRKTQQARDPSPPRQAGILWLWVMIAAAQDLGGREI